MLLRGADCAQLLIRATRSQRYPNHWTASLIGVVRSDHYIISSPGWVRQIQCCQFAGPEKTAPKSGIAMATVIVDSPARVAYGRTRVLRPDGQVAWIDSSELA